MHKPPRRQLFPLKLIMSSGECGTPNSACPMHCGSPGSSRMKASSISTKSKRVSVKCVNCSNCTTLKDKLYEERRLRNKAYRLSKEARDLLLDLSDLIYKLTKTTNLANEHMKGIETVVDNMNNQLSMAACLNLDNVD